MDDKDWWGIAPDWRNAKGIIWHKGETNSAFARRDYSIECKTGARPVVIVEGYHVWWCTFHHQLLYQCEKERARDTLSSLVIARIKQLQDKLTKPQGVEESTADFWMKRVRAEAQVEILQLASSWINQAR